MSRACVGSCQGGSVWRLQLAYSVRALWMGLHG